MRSKLTNLARNEGIYTSTSTISGAMLEPILDTINQKGIDILEKPIEELQKILETNDRTLVMSLKRNADAIAQAAVSLDATQQSLELLRIESIAAQVEAWDNLAYEHTEYQVAVNAVIASKITKEVVDEYAKNYDGKTDAQK
jgi:AAA+ superfamily predicted ATPase